MMQAFIDESRTGKDDRTTCVGGYLFEDKAATEFHSRWSEILQPFAPRGIDHMHAAKCARASKTFKYLKREERIFLFERMAMLIRELATLGFVAEVEAHIFDLWKSENPTVQGLVGSKYAACCLQCLRFIKGWADQNGFDGKINYVFERLGDPLSKRKHPYDIEREQLLSVLRRNEKFRRAFRYGGESHFAKGERHALEAADFLVWTYPSLHAELTDFTKISRKVFRKGRLMHFATTVTPTALTMTALFNDEHRLRENHGHSVRIFKA